MFPDEAFILGKEVKQPQDSPREGATPKGKHIDFTQEVMKKCQKFELAAAKATLLAETRIQELRGYLEHLEYGTKQLLNDSFLVTKLQKPHKQHTDAVKSQIQALDKELCQIKQTKVEICAKVKTLLDQGINQFLVDPKDQ